MVAEFHAFATRTAAPLTGLAQVLTGDREAAATLVHTILTRAYADRKPDERQAITRLVRAWLAGAPPVGEPEELPHDLELLRRSLDALPDKQRLAVALHHWSSLPVPEIAAILRRPERAVAADLAAGVAELHTPPDTPTVDARLAALVAAAGPPLVDLADVAEAGRAHRRQRHRTALAATGVLLAAGTAAALLTGGEPDTAVRGEFTAGDRFVVLSPTPDRPVVDDRARRLTAQLANALPEVLPGVLDPRSGTLPFPPLEFSRGSPYTPPPSYGAHVLFGSTLLVLQVEHSPDAVDVACPVIDCRYQQFPDGTTAYVLTHPTADNTRISYTLAAQRPDGTMLYATANNVGPALGPPGVTVENLLGFATVFTY